jgi:integrase
VTGRLRPTVSSAGERGHLVRLFKDAAGKRKAYIVQWREDGRRRQRAFPLTKIGKAEAEAFFAAFKDARATQASVRTTGALWERYRADQFPTLRPNSQRLYGEAWRHWVAFYGIARDPAALTLEECGAFRQHLEAKGLALATVRGTIRVVRGVYNWAERYELLPRNRWHGFRFQVKKGSEAAPRAEYRAHEFLAMWRTLNPTKPTQWRAWAVMGLLGIYGNRQHEVLALRWDWVTADSIEMPSAVTKQGKDTSLPLLPLARRILEVAKGHAERCGYVGPYVFFTASSKSEQPTYTIQSFWSALRTAEVNAKVPHITGRAGHGFRRGLVGDLADATGDVGFALQAIGDTMAMAKHYRVRRDDKLFEALAARLARIIPEGSHQSATESATDSVSPPQKES